MLLPVGWGTGGRPPLPVVWGQGKDGARVSM